MLDLAALVCSTEQLVLRRHWWQSPIVTRMGVVGLVTPPPHFRHYKHKWQDNDQLSGSHITSQSCASPLPLAFLGPWLFSLHTSVERSGGSRLDMRRSRDKGTASLRAVNLLFYTDCLTEQTVNVLEI